MTVADVIVSALLLAALCGIFLRSRARKRKGCCSGCADCPNAQGCGGKR